MPISGLTVSKSHKLYDYKCTLICVYDVGTWRAMDELKSSEEYGAVNEVYT